MRFSTFLTLAAASVLAVANPVNQAHIYDGADRQAQVPIGDVAPSMRTRTVTETQTFFEVIESVSMTKVQLAPTWVPAPPKAETVCDETLGISCAICRTIHQCTDFEEECIACDSAPACEACQPAQPPKAQTLPPVVNLGITCSLGPGRTVPCELVNKGDVRGPVYRFGDGA